MCGKNRRVGRHDQECTPRRSLHVAAETENETRDKIYDARGKRMVHVLQVDDYRNSPTIVLTDGGGIPKVSRTHYCDLDTVTHGRLATRGFIVVMNLTEVLGSVPVLVDHGVIIMLDETELSTGVALHHADLRRYEPIHGRPSGETMHQTLTTEAVRSTSTRRNGDR
jgi:hypothetical protein